MKTDLILKKDELHINYQIYYNIILGKFLKLTLDFRGKRYSH
jgi:hypothetical protein